MKNRQIYITLALVLAFVGLLVFISTSFELHSTLAGEVKTTAVGFGVPWFKHVTTAQESTIRLNLLAPSFLAGVIGFLIIAGYLGYYRHH
ncbi:MAG: hypothetical protein IPM53_19250 [Anaerolineaceae bacterium]|nr:hypothetical protein [Anaerolineaceae bacterium]